MRRPQPMPRPTRLRPGDPPAVPAPRRDPPVQAARQLERDHRPPPLHPRQEPRRHRPRLVPEHALDDLDPGRPQPRHAPPAHPGIRIAAPHHHPRDPRRHQRVRARRCRPEMAARLQRHGGAPAPRRAARHRQRPRLRVRPAALRSPPPPDDPPVRRQHDAPHRRVRPGRAQPAPRQPQRRAHRCNIVHDATMWGARASPGRPRSPGPRGSRGTRWRSGRTPPRPPP